ncbi:MAG: helix-turn-helix domain-containing protein [Proteobacteria bacterium]|nr:helix-turn-helix domain-containing protein [Pseudomonadota bacterium]
METSLNQEEIYLKDLGFSAPQSTKMNIKSHLMAEIETFIKTEKLTQEQASKNNGRQQTFIQTPL